MRKGLGKPHCSLLCRNTECRSDPTALPLVLCWRVALPWAEKPGSDASTHDSWRQPTSSDYVQVRKLAKMSTSTLWGSWREQIWQLICTCSLTIVTQVGVNCLHFKNTFLFSLTCQCISGSFLKHDNFEKKKKKKGPSGELSYQVQLNVVFKNPFGLYHSFCSVPQCVSWEQRPNY